MTGWCHGCHGPTLGWLPHLWTSQESFFFFGAKNPTDRGPTWENTHRTFKILKPHKLKVWFGWKMIFPDFKGMCMFRFQPLIFRGVPAS